jgi:hypothetical protein
LENQRDFMYSSRRFTSAKDLRIADTDIGNASTSRFSLKAQRLRASLATEACTTRSRRTFDPTFGSLLLRRGWLGTLL